MIYKELQREQEQFIETGDFTTDLQPAIEQLYREEGRKGYDSAVQAAGRYG